VLLVTEIGWFVKERLLGDRLTVVEVPVPLRLRDWGLPLALSVKLTEADRLPVAAGSNVTLIVQLAPAATELPQVFVWAKSPGLAPVSAMLERLKAALPPLVRVAVRTPLVVLTDWLPNERLLVDRLAVAEVPVPPRLRDWGLPLALSVKLTEADRLPPAVGSNVTLIVQLAPAATELPQVFVWAKSPGLAPVSAMPERLKAALPPLVRVAVTIPLLVLTDWLPNERLAGERLTAAAVPVPERLTVWGLPAELSATLSNAVRLPLAAGVKVMLNVQVDPAGSELPQLLVWAKSPGLAPVIVTLEMLRAPVPALSKVAVPAPLVVPTGRLPRARLPGERPAAGVAPATPTPSRLTFLRPAAPVEMLSVAKRVPVVLGRKVRLIVQLAPAASDVPQLLDCPNLLAFVPETARLVIDKDPLPVFSRVTFLAGLVVLTTTDPKVTLLADTPHNPRLRGADEAAVLEAERTASAIIVARRIPVIWRAWRNAQAGTTNCPSLWNLRD
jgi:hypothetical protein